MSKYYSRPMISSPLELDSNYRLNYNQPNNNFSNQSSSNSSEDYLNNNTYVNSPLNPSSPIRSTTTTSTPIIAHPLSHSTSFLDSSPNLTDSTEKSNSLVDQRPPIPPRGKLATFYRIWSGASIGDSGVDERHIKLPRLGYLDGLKFLAAWIVLNGTLFDAVLPPDQYLAIQRNSPLFIFRSTGLGITFFLLLLGRSVITPLWDVPPPTSTAAAGGIHPGTALISWSRLTRAMLLRPFRFILPVIAIAALQWGLGATGKLSQSNAVGMDEPYWGLIGSFSGLATLIFDLFTYYEQDTRAGQTFGANLWTVPWFFQSSYAVYVTHFMLGNLSSNRYWVYAILAFFSWCTYNFFFVAILGLLITDLHAHGVLHRIRTQWSVTGRITLHVALIAFALITQWVPVIRNNINAGMAVINVQNHPELTFCDSIFAFCVLFCLETSGAAQWALGNVVMRWLGKLSAGMYVLAPSIVYAIIPPVAATLNANGTSLSNTLLISWLILFGSGLAFAIVFHFFVELPSKLMGELFCDAIESMETREESRIKSVGGKLIKRNLK